MPKQPHSVRWTVYLVGKKQQFVGHVEAPDEMAAVEKAIQDFDIAEQAVCAEAREG